MNILNFISRLMLFLTFLNTQSVCGSEDPEINLTSLSKSQLPAPVKISIEKDPVYETSKVYEAYPLEEILKLIPTQSNRNTAETVIVFTATDGYEVSIPYDNAISERGYVAFRDLASTRDNQWIEFKFGKTMVTPAPYYLVWPKKGLDKWKYPWPFQLVKISFRSFSDYYGAAAPASKSTQMKKGFTVFTQYCIRCHSINLSGGEVGPELNVPKNITEYFKENALPGFILNAPAYRAGTKMPVFEKLISKEEMKNLLTYLAQMKNEKINVQ